MIDGLVLKCVAAPKTKTKDLANQIILMYVEIETQEKVIEALLGGLAQKNPKVCGTNSNSFSYISFKMKREHILFVSRIFKSS